MADNQTAQRTVAVQQKIIKMMQGGDGRAQFIQDHVAECVTDIAMRGLFAPDGSLSDANWDVWLTQYLPSLSPQSYIPIQSAVEQQVATDTAASAKKRSVLTPQLKKLIVLCAVIAAIVISVSTVIIISNNKSRSNAAATPAAIYEACKLEGSSNVKAHDANRLVISANVLGAQHDYEELTCVLEHVPKGDSYGDSNTGGVKSNGYTYSWSTKIMSQYDRIMTISILPSN